MLEWRPRRARRRRSRPRRRARSAATGGSRAARRSRACSPRRARGEWLPLASTIWMSAMPKVLARARSSGPPPPAALARTARQPRAGSRRGGARCPVLSCSRPASRLTMVSREVSATSPSNTPRTVAWARHSQPEPPWLGCPGRNIISSVRFSLSGLLVAVDEVLARDAQLQAGRPVGVGVPFQEVARQERHRPEADRGRCRRSARGWGCCRRRSPPRARRGWAMMRASVPAIVVLPEPILRRLPRPSSSVLQDRPRSLQCGRG